MIRHIIIAFLGIMVIQTMGASLQWNGENNFEGWCKGKRLECRISGGLLLLESIDRDSYILSGELNIDPKLHNRVTIRYRARGIPAFTAGQLYFENKESGFTNERVWKIPSLKGDGNWRELVLGPDSIRNPDKWYNGGNIRRLRLDMMDQEGGTIEIASIRVGNDPKSSVRKLDELAWPNEKSTIVTRTATAVVAENEPYFKGSMIRHPKDKGKTDSPGIFYFRRSFELCGKPLRAWLQYVSDDSAELYMNGRHIDTQTSWERPNVIEVTEYLKAGKNVWAMAQMNGGGAGGIFGELFILTDSGGIMKIDTDGDFKSIVATREKNWYSAEYDDRHWDSVLLQDAPPAAPWAVKLNYTDFSARQVVKEVSPYKNSYAAGEKFEARFVVEGKIPEKALSCRIRLLGDRRNILFEEFISVDKCMIQRLNGEQWTFRLAYSLPRWLNSCAMSLDLQPANLFLDGLKPMPFKYIAQLPDTQSLTSRIEKTPSGPRLMINNELIYPVIASGPLRRTDRPFGNAAINLLTAYTNYQCLWWTGVDQYDLHQIDWQVEKTLRTNPDARLIMYVYLYPPPAWGEAHKNELARFQDQSFLRKREYSFASPIARRDIEKALRVYIEHCENSPYRNRIAGYLLQSGQTTEWLGWHFNKSVRPGRMMDYSAPNRAGFKEFAAREYPGLTNIDLPSLTERLAGTGKSNILAPKDNLPAIAYNHYHSWRIADMLVYQVQAAKKILANRKVVGGYYGYLFELPGMAWGSQLGGHNALKKVIDSRSVDFLLSPPSYTVRNIGDSMGDMKPFSTLENNNIISIIEDDTRTHVSPPAGYQQTVNARQSREVMRRNMGICLARLQPLHFLAIDEVNFDFPEFAEDTGGARATGQFCYDNRVMRNAEIAVVVSESTMKYMPFESKFDNVGKRQTYKTDGSVAVGDRNSLHLTGELIAWQRSVISRIGAPVDYILAEDLKNSKKTYKLWIFLNSFAYDDEILTTIKNLRHEQTTLLWLYAPGLIYQGKADIANMKKLTGFELREISGGIIPAVKVDGRTLGLPTEIMKPAFHVAETDSARVLGRYVDSNLTGLAEKTIDRERSIFCGPHQLSVDFLQKIAKDCGIHLFCTSQDPMDANNALITLHAGTAGKKEIKLPGRADIVDVFQRKVVARNVDTFVFETPLHSSWLFYYGGDADKLLRTLK